MKILVIGKNGYISKCFQNYMKQFREYKVDAISARTDSWKEYSFKNYNAVFNATGLAHNDARAGTEEQFMRLNAILPVELAKKAKKEGVSVFINMSSMIVYGNMNPMGDYKKISLDTQPIPDNIYGRSKLIGEKGVLELDDDSFHVSVIRSSLVYSENAIDNFKKIVNFANKSPIFPNIKNIRSMIYSDNLCELVRLIIINHASGIFYPQQETHICISNLVQDIGKVAGHKVRLIKIFNPIIRIISRRVSFVRKVFGNEAYELDISNHFDRKYIVVDYSESIKRIGLNRKR